LILLPLLVLAQKREVFRIDSLPKEGVLLNQGWKWHAGDDPEWRKVDFDDASWPSINPALEIQNALNQIPRSGICWMRLHFSVNSNLQKTILALLVKQSGAAEIYLNEVKIQAFGILDADPQKVKAFDPNLKPMLFPINKNEHQVLAIRFALQPGIKYTSIFNTKSPGFSASIKKFNLAFEDYTQDTINTARFFGLSFGVFSLLFMIYFVIFCFYKDQKASLHFSLFFLFQLCYIIAEVSIDQKQLSLRFYSINLAFIAGMASNLCLLSAIYELFNSKKDWIFWFLFFLVLPAELLNLGYYNWGWHFGTALFGIFIKIKIIHITFQAVHDKKKGAWLMSIASLVHLSAYILFVWTANFLPNFPAVSTTLFVLYYASLPLATALFLGFDFAYTNQVLKLKLKEVYELSKKNLEQEQEKKELLITQNETLERQVTTRTAELSSKNTELELEASLERVRSKALAMQQSKEVLDVAAVLYDELQKLDFTFGTIGINLIEDKTNEMESWVAGFGHENYPQSYRIPYFDHPLQKSMIEAWRNGASYLVYQLQGEEKRDYDDFMFTQSDYKVIPEEVKQRMITTESATFSLAYMKHGALLWAPTPLSEKKALILQRFASVFEQVYTRFLDLQKAEAQAREAQIEVGLERVRSRISAMQKSSDLADCTQLLFQRIQDLKLPLFTCGFCFIEESLGIQRGGTVSPDGTLIPDLIDFPLTGDEVLDQRYESWKQKKPLHIAVLEGEANKEHHRFLASKVPTVFSDEIIKHIPDKIIFYSANFLQGYIIILTTVYLKKEEEQILQRFATVFEQTYTRFLDLQKAEAQAEQARLNLIQIQTEKKRAEEALIALKQTQAQLIQSEKLASLGELTAGIAHEIQNPLNFVNNFAEISVDLAEELKEEINKPELDKGLIEELATDLALNQEKINHHGQRASSIVKGMLEHSRVATSRDAINRVSTDINALADEYLRLAYHGLRAKDSSFNATMETHFDPDLPLVSVIPQDIGRVILNLINNAFYAVAEKAKQGIEGFQPTVTVSTQLRLTSAELSNRRSATESAIEISVKDNGNGIPETIKDKIFQPFFTTKPTGQGTGLGLSLAYDIVTKGHGGSLEVESTEGYGSEFRIILPIKSHI